MLEVYYERVAVTCNAVYFFINSCGKEHNLQMFFENAVLDFGSFCTIFNRREWITYVAVSVIQFLKAEYVELI